MSRVRALIERIESAQSGQGLVEYALILALIAVIVIGVLGFLGTQVSTTLSNIGQSI